MKIRHIKIEIKEQENEPALHDTGGSFCRSFNSLLILLEAIPMLQAQANIQTGRGKGYIHQWNNHTSPQIIMAKFWFYQKVYITKLHKIIKGVKVESHLFSSCEIDTELGMQMSQA